MDSTTIELPGSEIEAIQLGEGKLKVHFSRAYIIKTMSGSDEQTRWWQTGDLVFEEVDIEGDLPQCPCVCEGGDVGENVYTYRDMLPIPLDSHGHAHCDIRIQGQTTHLKVQASGVKLEMEDRPQYIEHIRD